VAKKQPRQKIKIKVGPKLWLYRAAMARASINDSRNRRHNKILRKELVRMMRMKRHFRSRSAR